MGKFSQIDSLPLEIINQYKSFATNVFDCAIQSQNNVYIIHGSGSEQENKEKLPHFGDSIMNRNYYTAPREMVHFHLNTTCGSIILSGLCRNTVIICNKINHVLMRQCTDSNIYIKKGTVSGVDVLNCHHIFIKMPYHNYTNIEYGENVHFEADADNTSQLSVIGSLDITSNGCPLPVNPFTSVIITRNGIFHRGHGMSVKPYICKY